MLNDELIRRWDVQRTQLLGRFRSKRNDVFKVRVITGDGSARTVVIKEFTDPDRFSEEIRTLRLLQVRGVPVPRLHHAEDGAAVYEFIEGKVLVDCIYRFPDQVTKGLSESLKQIYDALDEHSSELILRDMNMRNFIRQSGTDTVYRVDFESTSRGRREEDAGRLCAFCLSYDPPFTPQKMRTAWSLFQKLLCSLELCPQTTARWTLCELAEIGQRRQMPVPAAVKDAVRWWPT